MAGIVNEQITAFLETLGKQYPRSTKLTLLGGSALCLLGSPRPTMDIDYAGSDLQKNDFQRLMGEIANDMGLDVEAVPIHELTPLSYGEEKRAIHVGTFGNIEVLIIDPYVIALSKLDRGFDTDIEDIVFLIKQGLVSLPQLEQVVEDAIPHAGKFDMNPHELREHLQALRDELQ